MNQEWIESVLKKFDEKFPGASMKPKHAGETYLKPRIKDFLRESLTELQGRVVEKIENSQRFVLEESGDLKKAENGGWLNRSDLLTELGK